MLGHLLDADELERTVALDLVDPAIGDRHDSAESIAAFGASLAMAHRGSRGISWFPLIRFSRTSLTQKQKLRCDMTRYRPEVLPGSPAQYDHVDHRRALYTSGVYVRKRAGRLATGSSTPETALIAWMALDTALSRLLGYLGVFGWVLKYEI